MGGCMSSPKNVYEGGEAPVEPITPKAAEGDNVPQENKEEVEKKEEPLIDISEPPIEAKAETEAEAEVAAPAIAEEAKKEEEAKPAEEAEKKDEIDVPLITL
ncbi:hypothetical protein PIB30_062392 [Stylosanthes scabra]|uniref:Uncharacterized protein n=1 Tax=Stylosanthes scabra TaxID=79078 RepID=A0ABU6ZJU1_9FABA|nr:hypothetical protein [Stylosanthes scabra]